MKRINLFLGLSFSGYMLYAIVSWLLLFRDSWTVEVITTKFYPEFSAQINRLAEILAGWKLNTVPTVLFGLVIIFLFGLYFSILKQKLSLRTVILASLAFQIIILFSYPALSTDVLSYILSDRVAVVYHRNVWTTKPNEFKNDPYYYLVYPIYPTTDWTNQTRIYGGTNQAVYSLATAVSGNDFAVNLLSHKLVVFAFNLGTIFLVWLILSRFFPKELVSGMKMVFLNPLFIIETVGSGHNDILMIFFMLLAYFFVLSRKFWLSGLALALSTQVKSTSLLFAVVLGGYLLGQKRIKDLAVFGLFYGLTVLGIYYLMGINIFSVVRRTAYSTSVYWQSLPMLVNKFLPSAKILLTAGLGVFLLWQMYKTVIKKENPLKIYVEILLVYLLFFLNAYWNWYPIWILTLLPFIPDNRLQKVILAFTLTSLLGYVTFWLSLRFDYQLFIWPVIMYLTILSGPAAVFLYDRYFKKIPD